MLNLIPCTNWAEKSEIYSWNIQSIKRFQFVDYPAMIICYILNFHRGEKLFLEISCTKTHVIFYGQYLEVRDPYLSSSKNVYDI